VIKNVQIRRSDLVKSLNEELNAAKSAGTHSAEEVSKAKRVLLEKFEPSPSEFIKPMDLQRFSSREFVERNELLDELMPAAAVKTVTQKTSTGLKSNKDFVDAVHDSFVVSGKRVPDTILKEKNKLDIAENSPLLQNLMREKAKGRDTKVTDLFKKDD